jgi:hypothetical protein
VVNAVVEWGSGGPKWRDRPWAGILTPQPSTECSAFGTDL